MIKASRTRFVGERDISWLPLSTIINGLLFCENYGSILEPSIQADPRNCVLLCIVIEFRQYNNYRLIRWRDHLEERCCRGSSMYVKIVDDRYCFVRWRSLVLDFSRLLTRNIVMGDEIWVWWKIPKKFLLSASFRESGRNERNLIRQFLEPMGRLFNSSNM